MAKQLMLPSRLITTGTRVISRNFQIRASKRCSMRLLRFVGLVIKG